MVPFRPREAEDRARLLGPGEEIADPGQEAQDHLARLVHGRERVLGREDFGHGREDVSAARLALGGD